MSNQNIKKIAVNKSIIFLITVVILLLLVIALINMQNENKPVAENGIIDLRGKMNDLEKPFYITGDWEIIYGEHVEPRKIEERIHDIETIKVPSTWKGEEYKGNILHGEGIATYRLRIVLDKGNTKRVGMIIPGWESAYTLYINNELYKEIGKIGLSKEEEIPRWEPTIIFLPENEEEIELVFHISNFHHARGGPAMAPRIGYEQEIVWARGNGLALRFFAFGSLITMALYHLITYLFRKKEKATLFFAIFCLVMALRNVLVNEHGILLIWNSISWDVHIKLTYLTFTIGLPIFVLFIENMFPNAMYNTIAWGIKIISLMYGLLILFLPSEIFTSYLIIIKILTGFSAIYCLVVLIKAAILKYQQANLFLIAFIFYFVFIFNDLLYHSNLLNSFYIVPIGSMIMIFIQSIILSRQYSMAFDKIEELLLEKIVLEDEAKSFKNLTYIDSLTGIYNRRKFDEYIIEQWEFCKEHNFPISLLMIDIDFFKKYNDQYGHPMGDNVLRKIAITVNNTVRHIEDCVARYGGEEFVVLLPNTKIKDAVFIAEKIRTKVEKLNIQSAKNIQNPYVTISIGCKMFYPKIEGDYNILVQEADRQLYRAKENGRNRIEY